MTTDARVVFFEKLIDDRTKRILELGPLNYPVAKKAIYPNCYYCDIRSTEDVRKLYSGNEYLEATGIKVDVDTIVPIDYVIQNNYTETFAEIEKFDYVIASHVLEHMDDLIFALQDISNVLKPGGIFCICYPDRRYAFDHFRASSSFRDAYHVFSQGKGAVAPMVLDFFYSVTNENDPVVFWKNEKVLEHLPTGTLAHAVERYRQAMQGVRMDDVHYWPFTDFDFLQFLYDVTRAGLLPYRCVAFEPCEENSQQFMIALQYAPDVCLHPEEALEVIKTEMRSIPFDYYSGRDIARRELCRKLKGEVEQLSRDYEQLSREYQELEQRKMEYEEQLLLRTIRIEELETIENSTIWRMTKPVRFFLDLIKGERRRHKE